MIILNATTKSLEAVLAGAVAANQLPIVANYVDVTATTYTPGESDTQTNSTTGVTAVAAPAASTQRQVKLLTVYNADTAIAPVTLRYNNNGTLRTLHKVALPIGATLVYTDGEGFRVIDANGNVLGTNNAGGGSGAFTVISNAATGAVNDWAPAGMSGNTVIEWNGASDAAFTGLAGGTAGQIARVKNITAAKIATFANLVTSAAGNQFANLVTSAPTPVAPGGWIDYQNDGTNWKLVGHEQGAWIAPAYAAGDFTAQGSMTWTVDAGDVNEYRYKLSGRTLAVAFTLRLTSVGGTLNKALYIKVPGGFSIAQLATAGMMYNDNAGSTYLFAASYADPALATQIQLYVSGFGTTNWSASTNLTHVYGNIPIEVA